MSTFRSLASTIFMKPIFDWEESQTSGTAQTSCAENSQVPAAEKDLKDLKICCHSPCKVAIHKKIYKLIYKLV